jgi:hypothetical protein
MTTETNETSGWVKVRASGFIDHLPIFPPFPRTPFHTLSTHSFSSLSTMINSSAEPVLSISNLPPPLPLIPQPAPLRSRF